MGPTGPPVFSCRAPISIRHTRYVLVPLLLALTLAAPSEGSPAAPGAGGGAGRADASVRADASGPASLLAQLDQLYLQRDDAVAMAEGRRLVLQALQSSPGDFELLWRAARFEFWLSDDPGSPAELRSAAGKRGLDLAERAMQVRPAHAAGHYWAAVNMAGYALGLGIFRALSQNLDGKFRDRIGRALELDMTYEAGSVLVAWGRFFDKLPWPKRDAKVAEASLRKALELNPRHLRAKVYLADLLLHEGKAPAAKQLLDEVAAAPPFNDPAEERRAKALAGGLMPAVLKKLK